MVADGSCQRQSPFQFQLLEFIVPDGSTVFLKHSLHKITAEYKQMYKNTHTQNYKDFTKLSQGIYTK